MDINKFAVEWIINKVVKESALIIDSSEFGDDFQKVWDTFFQDEPLPEILVYLADTNLDLEHSKEINAFITTMDEDFEVWDSFYTPEAYDCGKAILKYKEKNPQIGITLNNCHISPAEDGYLWISIRDGEAGRFSVADLDLVVMEYFWKAF